jgi:hypothetical protein
VTLGLACHSLVYSACLEVLGNPFAISLGPILIYDILLMIHDERELFNIVEVLYCVISSSFKWSALGIRTIPAVFTSHWRSASAPFTRRVRTLNIVTPGAIEYWVSETSS